LVPLGDLVLRFQRLIRDLSNQLGKKVEFKTSGIETELDKNTIDQLAEPLMHIIRNCIDHGIETPENRIKNGKQEHGTISLTAYNSGNFAIISIFDDGNGIDLEKVKQKAVDKGILKPKDKPEKKEILDLIFLPGFSTAQSLTSISGRGVGMDIVKKRIVDLRGEVTLSSETGSGTTFTLKIPQSLSIIDTLLFTIEDNYFTVPISEIEVCLQFKANIIEERRHTATLPYNDHLISYIDLRHLMQIEGVYKEMTKAIIIKNENQEIALIADKIVGEHQAVLKPLGKSFRNQNYITSASQLGDGNMAFMIDTHALFNNL
jgi:two-component system chemotaxis sensor kinase CheA